MLPLRAESFPRPGDREIRMLVIGDSITWGQGLLEGDKMHSRLASVLRSCNSGLTISKTVLAHSGAIIGTAGSDTGDRLPGEIPTSLPTILQQVDLYDGDPAEVDLVLMDGGINDVGLTSILCPFVSPNTIADRVQQHCSGRMGELLQKVTQRFPNAKVVVTGYYQIFSGESALDLTLEALVSLGIIAGGLWNCEGGDGLAVLDSTTRDKLINNCRVFATESRARLRSAVSAMNERLGGGRRVLFADPDFQPDEALFAPDALLFGFKKNFLGQTIFPPLPEDPVAGDREAICFTSGFPVEALPKCVMASVGHPNAAGEAAYASAIYSALTTDNGGLIWADFTRSCDAFGCGAGTYNAPFRILQNAIDVVAPGGTIRIRSSSTPAKPLLSKKCTIDTCGGSVVIGL